MSDPFIKTVICLRSSELLNIDRADQEKECPNEMALLVKLMRDLQISQIYISKQLHLIDITGAQDNRCRHCHPGQYTG